MGWVLFGGKFSVSGDKNFKKHKKTAATFKATVFLCLNMFIEKFITYQCILFNIALFHGFIIFTEIATESTEDVLDIFDVNLAIN